MAKAMAAVMSAALQNPSTPLCQDVCRLLIRVLVQDPDALDRYVSRRARTELAKRIEDLFPRQKRLISASRGAEPALLVLVGDYTDQYAQLGVAVGEFLSNQTKGISSERAAQFLSRSVVSNPMSWVLSASWRQRWRSYSVGRCQRT